MILCLGTTPAAQRVMIFRQLRLDAVNRAVTTLDGAAGKSINVAKVLLTLGTDPLATGFLGGARGEQLRQMLEARGLELDFVSVIAPTRQCVTVLDQATGNVTELVEESRPVEAAAYETLMAIVQRRVRGAQAVVMSGTIASGGPPDLYLRCTELAHQAGALTIADASGPPLLEALKARPGLVKPNRAELEATAGRPLPNESALLAAMRELQGRGARRVVVTAGAQPALALEGNSAWRITTPKISVVNPIGSGDAFTAGLTSRLVHGESLGEACRWGAAAGAANALTPMPGDLKRADVERLITDVQVELI